ncbi:MAG TPA: alkaline phosphatase family protein [Gemmatimonadales bacterium]|nr:alkaline phosphatase family protein [Gemmatimonadales bacterium]
MARFRPPLVAVLALLLLAVAPPPAAPALPRLVLVLTLDQLRPDYLPRFESQWTGGFRRLLDQGAVFLEGRQDHALTETAPGHATILSGRHPVHTGIAYNDAGVPDSTVQLVGVAGMGASPRRFRGTTLVDWLRSADTAVRFLSVSRKDRGAILPIGRSRGPVFWYSGGRFTTSTWYSDTLPAWVTAWDARGGAPRLAGSRWQLLLPDSAYAEPDDQPWEDGGRETTFPHDLPRDTARAVEALADRPWIDSLTFDFALTGARALGLGQRGRPDLLAVSLSGLDYIGHDWGPDSREVHDHLLRVDRWLGTFLDSLETLVGKGQLLVVVTADHGVTSFPERAAALGQPGGRIPLSRLVRSVNPAVGGALRTSSGLVLVDTMRLKAVRVNRESLATALAAQVQKLPGVVDAWTPGTLGAPLPSNIGAARWRRSLPRDLPWLVCAVPRPGYIWSDGPGSTTHGTSNPDDVNVPIVFMGPGIRAGRHADTVSTVDIAPTLAKLLGVKVGEKVDGRVIKGALR